jgi:TPP-dependent 2-oxoacid decarboxylase
VVLNNGVYAIEQQIHDNPAYGYNVLNAWDYVAFVKALDAGRGRAFAARAATPAALAAALAAAAGEHAARVCVIEAVLTPEDVAPELREYGRRLAALTGRPPA